MSPDIPENLRSAAEGDARSIERLLADCRPNLSRYARRHCESEDVEDAVQDALVIIANRLSGLRSLTAFAAWTFKIVKHACLGLSRAGRQRALPLEDHDLPIPASQEIRVAVAQSLARLPRAQREAVILKDVVGLTAEQMATMTGRPLEAVKARLHQGRMAIRDDLGRAPPREREPRLGVR